MILSVLTTSTPGVHVFKQVDEFASEKVQKPFQLIVQVDSHQPGANALDLFAVAGIAQLFQKQNLKPPSETF